MSDPITLLELQNASTDEATFAEFINSLEAKDLVSRLGAVYPTLVKAVQRIGFSDIVTWTTTTLFNDFQVLVVIGTQTYRLAKVHTSGVFATDLAAGNWLIFSGNAVQTSKTDQTVNALMVVGAAGLLGDAITLSDYDEIDFGGFFEDIGAAIGNSPDPEAFNRAVLASSTSPGNFGAVVIRAVSAITNLRAWITSQAGDGAIINTELWTKEILDQETLGGMGTLRLMKNISGGSITNSTLVSGASLQFAFANTSGVITGSGNSPSGTWKQVAALSIADTAFGYFTRTE
jgi:hypothetical protein